MITYEQAHELMGQANLVILFGVIELIGLSLFLEIRRNGLVSRFYDERCDSYCTPCDSWRRNGKIIFVAL